jgi:hypothetical protein
MADRCGGIRPTRDAARSCSCNVLAIAQDASGSNVIVLSGLAHMQSDEGEALWIARDNGGTWQISKRADLKSSPRAHAAHPRGIVVAHASGIDLVSSKQTIEPLATVEHLVGQAFFSGSRAARRDCCGRALFVSLFRPNAKGYGEEIYLPSLSMLL